MRSARCVLGSTVDSTLVAFALYSRKSKRCRNISQSIFFAVLVRDRRTPLGKDNTHSFAIAVCYRDGEKVSGHLSWKSNGIVWKLFDITAGAFSLSIH